jgi:Asp-tRNA(Asn)/Glu-tRNA(Gln) amidotransferase A subunit family amidase
MAHNFHRDYEKGAEQMSVPLRQIIERGRGRSAMDYTRALAGVSPLNEGLGDVFNEYDAILTPAAPGEAPFGLQSTGSPIFCTIWSYLGTPAVTLPLLRSESGMPIGVQLVGRRDNDARLLRTARWLVRRLAGSGRRKGSGNAEARTATKGKRKRTSA